MASASFTESNWSNYFEVTSDNTLVDNTNGNIVYSTDVHSAPPAGFWSTVASDGSDLRVVNSAGDTAYSFEIEEIDTTNNNLTVFWDSQNLATGSDTTWRIYYGNGSATAPADSDTLGRENIWSINRKAVYHLGSTEDSSSSNLTLTNNGVTNASNNIGNTSDFDGSSHYNVSASPLDFTNTDFSISFWLNLDTIANNDVILANGAVNTAGYVVQIKDETGNPQSLLLITNQDGSNQSTPSNDDSVTLDTWELWHVVRSGTSVTWYKNGVDVTEGAEAASHSDPASTTDDMHIGAYVNDGLDPDMFLDELRYASTSLSASYVSTEYNNQSNANFWTVGTEQSVGGGDTSRIFNIS